MSLLSKEGTSDVGLVFSHIGGMQLMAPEARSIDGPDYPRRKVAGSRRTQDGGQAHQT